MMGEDWLDGFTPDEQEWLRRQVAAAPPMSDRVRRELEHLLASQARGASESASDGA